MTHELKLPTVAVLLAAYNGGRWITSQIDSILNQKGVVLKVFISIDPSSDNTLSLCNNICSYFNNVEILPFDGKFGGAARNFFRLLRDVDFSQFDYVSFADQDDIWLPDKLSRAHQVLVATGADAYSSNVLAFWPSGRQVLIEKSQQQRKWDFLFEAAGPGCTYVVTKKMACAVQHVVKNRWANIQQVGLHDWFVYAFVRANGFNWVIDKEAGMLYRQHEKNQVGVNAGWRAFVHRGQKILSGWGLSQSVLIAELVGLGDDPFVTKWSNGRRWGLLWLVAHAGQCRRRLRDQFIFSLSCVVLSLIRPRRP